MIKTILFCIAIFLSASCCFALSDAEYKAMMQSSPEYRQAEVQLAQAWKRACASVKGKGGMGWRELRDNQRDWLARLRDAEAKVCIDSGMSRTEAYIAVTRDRIVYLESFAD